MSAPSAISGTAVSAAVAPAYAAPAAATPAVSAAEAASVAEAPIQGPVAKPSSSPSKKAVPARLKMPRVVTLRGFGRKLKKVLGCLLVFVLLALPAPFVNNAIGYFPAIAFLFVLALSFAYLRLLKRGLVYEEAGVGSGCQRGEKLNLSLVVKNDSILPATSLDVEFFISDLFGGEREKAVRRVSLPPRSSKTFDFAVEFDHIGTYSVGIRRIQASDPFGIFHYEKVQEELHEVSVQPRIFDINAIEVQTDSIEESKRALTSVISDGMDYCGVREYRWGDPIKAVHWKLSASSPLDEYYTRLYETNSSPGVTIFLDVDSLDYDEEDLMGVYDVLVESALSIERWSSQCGYETDIMFLDDDGLPARFEGPLSGHYVELLEILPRVRRGNGLATLELFRNQAASIYAKNNFIMCSACLTDELAGEMIRTKTSRLKPILVAVEPPHSDVERQRMLRSKLNRLSVAQVDYAFVSGAEQLAERD